MIALWILVLLFLCICFYLNKLDYKTTIVFLKLIYKILPMFCFIHISLSKETLVPDNN